MKRLPSFLFGVIIGAGLVFTTLKYHVVRASDGLHVVPKVSAVFSETYVDIRSYSPRDWANHAGLALALRRADKGYLLVNSAGESVIDLVEDIVDRHR